MQPLASVVEIGVQAIYDWCEEHWESSNLQDVILYSFNRGEAKVLTEACHIVFFDTPGRTPKDAIVETVTSTQEDSLAEEGYPEKHRY